MVLKNAIFVDENFKKAAGDIAFNGEIITEIGEDIDEKISSVDVSGMLVVPGFIDVHLHGCGGFDCSDVEKNPLPKMAKTLAFHGVTSFIPAIITDTLERQKFMLQQLSTAQIYSGARMVGIRAEGSFLCEKRRGAHNAELLRNPTIDELKQLYDASNGKLNMVDVAPELEDAISFIRSAVYNDFIVSIAHTDCDYDTACKAYEAGATDTTHLYNCTSPLNHREPGVVGAAFDCKEPHFAEIICDGVHIHPAAVRIAVRELGKDRLIFITDSMEAAGMGDGVYSLGGDPVIVKNGEARREDGALAGSVLTLDEAVRRAVNMGIPFEVVLRAVTINPARLIKMDDQIGSIKVGKRADLTVLDSNLNVVMTFVGGKLFNRGIVK